MLGEVIPPDPNVLDNLRYLLIGGDYDFSRLPRWVRRFEIKYGALERCIEFVGNDILPSYCKDGFVVVVRDNNQIVGVARRFTTIRATVGGGIEGINYDFFYEYYAKLPRFMGILRNDNTNVLFVIRDGVVVDAWELTELTPSMVMRILSKKLWEPYWCSRSKDLANMVFDAIEKVSWKKLRHTERDELIKQLSKVL